jgi:hypothetical protein
VLVTAWFTRLIFWLPWLLTTKFVFIAKIFSTWQCWHQRISCDWNSQTFWSTHVGFNPIDDSFFALLQIFLSLDWEASILLHGVSRLILILFLILFSFFFADQRSHENALQDRIRKGPSGVSAYSIAQITANRPGSLTITTSKNICNTLFICTITSPITQELMFPRWNIFNFCHSFPSRFFLFLVSASY